MQQTVTCGREHGREEGGEEEGGGVLVVGQGVGPFGADVISIVVYLHHHHHHVQVTYWTELDRRVGLNR